MELAGGEVRRGTEEGTVDSGERMGATGASQMLAGPAAQMLAEQRNCLQKSCDMMPVKEWVGRQRSSIESWLRTTQAAGRDLLLTPPRRIFSGRVAGSNLSAVHRADE